jgi:hypothetical protein
LKSATPQLFRPRQQERTPIIKNLVILGPAVVPKKGKDITLADTILIYVFESRGDGLFNLHIATMGINLSFEVFASVDERVPPPFKLIESF